MLIYELLDAHDDTARMAADPTLDPTWGPHLDYLRALQRKGREVLARATLDQAAGAPAGRRLGTPRRRRRPRMPGAGRISSGHDGAGRGPTQPRPR